MERVFAAGVAADAERLNFRFHQRIHRLARSRRLASVIRGLARAIPTEFYETHSDWPTKAHEDHVRIAGALSAGDSDRARQETEWHFADGGARAVRHLEELGFWGHGTTPA
jgi:DNA-binding GntR family transcriptional regulator